MTAARRLLLLLPLAAAPHAAVLDFSPAGFTVKTVVEIEAAPDAVYRRLFRPGEWWSSDHTFSGDARNLSMEEKPMGCFCEKLPNGGAVRHMEVVHFAPGSLLVLQGALGPLQGLAAAGSMSIRLAAAEGGTRLEPTYAVVGYLPAGIATWAAPVDAVVTQQFERLRKSFEPSAP